MMFLTTWRSSRAGVAVALLMAGAAPSGAGAQAPAQSGPDVSLPPVVFQLEVNYVEVPTVVTDEDGNFVRGLTVDDFELLEGGERQNVTAFALVDIPVQRPQRPAFADEPVEPDVHVTRPTFDGRVYVLLLDDLHTSALRTQQVRQYATRFIDEHLGANDLAAVVYTSGRSGDGQELTSRRSLLRAAVDRFVGRKLPSATGEQLGLHLRTQVDGDMLRDLRDDPLDNADRTITRDRDLRGPLDAERAFNARRALATIEQIAGWMGRVNGRRKALVVFSEGLDYDIYAPFNRRGIGIVSEARDAIGAAQRSNVSLYTIDARGLVRTPGEAIDTQGLSTDPAVQAGGALGYQNEILLSQEGLIAMADETGGLAIVNTNDVGGSLDRIVRENSTYYLLGYSTDPDHEPGRFRRIEVRVDRPNLRVRARRGFVTGPARRNDTPSDRWRAGREGEEVPPSLDVALDTPLPVGELPLRVAVAAFRGTDPERASLFFIVEADGDAFRLRESAGRFSGDLDTSIVALDYDGNIVADDHPGFALNLQRQTYEMVRRHGVRLYARIELPVGRYQIRVGAYESAGGISSAMPFEVEIPDYAEARLALSGLVITSTDAALTPTPRPDPELAFFPTPPSATRRFREGEDLGLFAEVYSRPDSPRQRIDFVATVRDARDGRTVFTLQDDWSVEEQTHGVAIRVPLAGLGVGPYVLRASAEVRGTDTHVARDVPFDIVQ